MGLFLIQVVQDLIDFGAVGDGAVGNKVELRAFAQMEPVAQLPAKEAGSGIQALDGFLGGGFAL